MSRSLCHLKRLCLGCVASLLIASLLIVAVSAFARDAKDKSVAVADRSPAIVIGFVGGFVRANDPVFGTVRLANRLRGEYPSGVVVRVFENHHEARARREVLRLLRADADGNVSAAEKKNARIIIYGHSWGGSETVRLARQLERQGIPVLLTVQVDSVPKPGENGAVIPPNVGEAANFFQPNGVIHGVSRIRAADPAATDIVGNFRFDYKQHPLSCAKYPWQDRVLMKTHTEIDCDPQVWSEVESLIRSKLPEETQGQ